MKSRPIGLGLGVLGILGFQVIYKLSKRSNVFITLSGPESDSFLWGNERLLFSTEHSSTIHNELLGKYGSVCKLKSVLGEDQLWIADPRALNDILLKAHEHFHEPESLIAWLQLALGKNIITTTGHKHKLQRKILNPVFTASHMRNLTPVITAIAHLLEDTLARKAQENKDKNGVVDMIAWMSNASLEIIGQAGMGHVFGAMEEKEPDYLRASHSLLPSVSAMWYLNPFIGTLVKIGPAPFRRFVVDHLPFAKVQALKKHADVVDNTATSIYLKKKRAFANGTLDSEIAAGNDIISMLLKQSQTLSAEEQMTEEEIIAQVNALVFAGNDTTSSALARTFDLLAQYPDVQSRLREEVREAHGKHGKSLDYNQLNSLVFLDAVCRESLRLFPPAQRIQRVAVTDWNLPLQHPVKSKDGRSIISNLHVPKGTKIHLSIAAANRDKQIWGEDADQFNPSRWLQPLPNSVTESKLPGAYSNMMSFSGGPRVCLGLKFAQLEMKVVLSTLVSSLSFEPGNDEITWVASGIAKPFVKGKNAAIDISRGPAMPMRVTVLE